MHFEYKGHSIAITETMKESFEGRYRIRIDDGCTSDFYGTSSDAVSTAKQWIDANSLPI
jgi:hypothetical protein